MLNILRRVTGKNRDDDEEDEDSGVPSIAAPTTRALAGPGETRRFGLEDDDEREILDAATRSVMGDVRGVDPRGAASSLTRPNDDDEILGAGIAGVREDQRAADPTNATRALAGQPPIIDLGADSEFVVPRSTAYGLADENDPSAPFNVQSRPLSVREPVRSLSSTPSAPRFAPAPEPTGRFSTVAPGWERAARGNRRLDIPRVQPLPGGPLPRLSDIGLVDDEDPIGTTLAAPDGTVTVVGASSAPQVAPQAPNPDDEVIGADLDADADLSVSEPVDPRRRAKMFGPAVLTTPQEQEAIDRAATRDRRSTIARRVLGGIGAGLGVIGGFSGSPGLIGMSQLTGGVAGDIPTNNADRARAAAEARRVREQGGIDRENALVNADNEAMRQDQQDQIRAQAAASDEALNQARIDGIISENEARELAQQARSGNVEAARATLQARVDAIQHRPTREAWQARLDTMLQSQDPEQLLDQTRFAAATDIRRGGQGAGGSGGASERTVTDPRTGITTTVRSGGGGQQQRPSPNAPTGTPTPDAPRPGRPRPGAPAPAPAGTTPDAATPAPEQQYLDELRVMTEAYPDLRDGEFDIARTAVMRNRLSISDLTSPDTRRRAAAQGVVRTAIQRYRAGTDATRERMQQQAQSTYATQVGGEVVMPETVDPVVFAPMAQRAEPVYQEYVAPFLQARRSLEAVRRAGVGEAGILLALQGANNDTIANFIRERGIQDPNAARALQRLKNSAANMREMYGRTQSGAAISPTEWSQFQNIMGMNHLYLNGSAQFQAAMEDLEQNGRRVVSSRFTPAGEHARDYASYFYRSLAGATGGQ